MASPSPAFTLPLAVRRIITAVEWNVSPRGAGGGAPISRSCRLTQPSPTPTIRDQNFMGINWVPSSKREKTSYYTARTFPPAVATSMGRLRIRWPRPTYLGGWGGGGEKKDVCYTMTASYISAHRNITTQHKRLR